MGGWIDGSMKDEFMNILMHRWMDDAVKQNYIYFSLLQFRSSLTQEKHVIAQQDILNAARPLH